MLLGLGIGVLKYRMKWFKLERRLGKKAENSFFHCFLKLSFLCDLITAHISFFFSFFILKFATSAFCSFKVCVPIIYEMCLYTIKLDSPVTLCNYLWI